MATVRPLTRTRTQADVTIALRKKISLNDRSPCNTHVLNAPPELSLKENIVRTALQVGNVGIVTAIKTLRDSSCEYFPPLDSRMSQIEHAGNEREKAAALI